MYEETLPQGCPPSNATEPINLVVFRLLRTDTIGHEDFHSHTKLGLALPAGVDDCRWASCSVFDDLSKAAGLKRLPKFKNSRIARLTLTRDAGCVLKGGNGHYDWWMYRTFDPVAASTIVL